MAEMVNKDTSKSYARIAIAVGLANAIAFAALVTLKLYRVIDWSWLWVTANVWGTFIMVLIIAFIAYINGTNQNKRTL